MRLHQELELKQVWLTAVKLEPGKEQPKVTLLFRTELTRDVAEAFGCRELIYAGDVPRSGVESMRLEGEERDCEVELSNDGGVKLRVVADFLSGYSVLMEGTGPKLKFQVRLTGYEVAAAELIRQAKADPVSLILKPAQMELPLRAEGETEDEEGETAETSGETDEAPAETPAEQADFMQELIQ